MRGGRGHERRRRRAVVGTVLFAAAGPGVVLGVVPRRLARDAPGASGPGARSLGWALVGAGAPLVVDAFVRFVRAAGTPAPVFETTELVAEGPYRWTRNPQYVGIVSVLAGEALLTGSRKVLAWAAAVATGFHLWVVVYEEPRLRHRFGASFDAYARRTPRWLPLGRIKRSR